MPLIICMGEALIDFLPLPERSSSADFRMHPAGSILNVAVGVARLGQPVAFAGKISQDYFGRCLRDYIVSEGINTCFLTTASAPSTLAFVAMEADQPTFGFYGEGAADTLLTLDDIPAALIAETSILHIGSISLLRGSTPATILATVQQLRGKALLSLDPNIRPALVKDEQLYRTLLRQLYSLVDVIKLSDADLTWLAPGKSSQQAIHDLLAAGAALAVVTRGPAGAQATTRGGVQLDLPGAAVEVVDTVGAGDTFCAALLAQLQQQGFSTRASVAGIAPDDLQQIVRFAIAAAALNCTRAGANPPTLAEVHQFLAHT